MAKVVGIDLGGTYIRAGVVEGKNVLDYIKEETPKTKTEILKKIIKIISLVLKKDIRGIGVAYPGILKNGFVEKTPNLPIQNFNLKKFLEENFQRKIVVENDAKCVALSEIKYGTKKKNFIVITLGTGVGGGIVINKKLYKGDGNAGEIGHIIIDDGKDLEFFWKKNIAEMKKNFGKEFLIRDLIKSKDKKAKKILGEIYRTLGMGIGSLVSAFDPEEIILMGGVREGGRKFIDGVSREIKKYTIIKKIPKMRWSKIKHPGVLGAGLLLE